MTTPDSDTARELPKPLRSERFVRSVDVVDLAAVPVDYDLTVEEMAALFPRSSSDINTEHYRDCHAGMKGQYIEDLALVRMYCDPFARWSFQRLIDVLAVLGFVPTELPTLAALAPYTDELAALRIDPRGEEFSYTTRLHYAACLGPNSLWKDAPYKCVKTIATCINLEEKDRDRRGIHEFNLAGGWEHPALDWVITRRVAPSEDPDTCYFVPPERKRRSRRKAA